MSLQKKKKLKNKKLCSFSATNATICTSKNKKNNHLTFAKIEQKSISALEEKSIPIEQEKDTVINNRTIKYEEVSLKKNPLMINTRVNPVYMCVQLPLLYYAQ